MARDSEAVQQILESGQNLAPERVHTDESIAGDDIHGSYVSSDSTYEYPVRFSALWARWTSTGVHGDPRPATKEKGAVIFDAAVTKLIALADEWSHWPIAPRSDQHTGEVRSDIRW